MPCPRLCVGMLNLRSPSTCPPKAVGMAPNPMDLDRSSLPAHVHANPVAGPFHAPRLTVMVASSRSFRQSERSAADSRRGQFDAATARVNRSRSPDGLRSGPVHWATSRSMRTFRSTLVPPEGGRAARQDVATFANRALAASRVGSPRTRDRPGSSRLLRRQRCDRLHPVAEKHEAAEVVDQRPHRGPPLRAVRRPRDRPMPRPAPCRVRTLGVFGRGGTSQTRAVVSACPVTSFVPSGK